MSYSENGKFCEILRAQQGLSTLDINGIIQQAENFAATHPGANVSTIDSSANQVSTSPDNNGFKKNPALSDKSQPEQSFEDYPPDKVSLASTEETRIPKTEQPTNNSVIQKPVDFYITFIQYRSLSDQEQSEVIYDGNTTGAESPPKATEGPSILSEANDPGGHDKSDNPYASTQHVSILEATSQVLEIHPEEQLNRPNYYGPILTDGMDYAGNIIPIVVPGHLFRSTEGGKNEVSIGLKVLQTAPVRGLIKGAIRWLPDTTTSSFLRYKIFNKVDPYNLTDETEAGRVVAIVVLSPPIGWAIIDTLAKMGILR